MNYEVGKAESGKDEFGDYEVTVFFGLGERTWFIR